MRIALVSIFVWYNYIACFNTNVIRIKLPHRQSSSKMNTENHRNRAKLDSPNTYVHGRAHIYTSHGTGTSPNLIPRTHMHMAVNHIYQVTYRHFPKLDSPNTYVHGRPIIYAGLGTGTSPNTYVHGRPIIYTGLGTGTSPNIYVHGRPIIYTRLGTGTSPNLIPRTHMYMAAQSYIPGLVQALPRTHMYMAAQSYIPGLVQALPKLDSLNTHVHGRPIIYSGLGTSTSILSEGLYSFMKPNLHS